MMIIQGNTIYLKLMTVEDVTDDYVSWMNDEEVVQYTESRWNSYTMDDLREFVKKTNNGISNFMFAIHSNENDLHIGNIKIGNINPVHRYADLGIVIGNKDYWGKGIATESIMIATKYAFEELNLNKLFAGMYAKNLGSFKAFIKAGYREIGVMRKHVFYKGEFIDSILVDICMK